MRPHFIVDVLLMAAVMSLGCHSIANPRELMSVSITLERTRCEGLCPAYIVTISGDGSVKYFGEHYVDIPGAQRAQIQPTKLKELLRAFEDIHFLSLQDRYTGDCTDNPTHYISLTVDGKNKRIENYFCGGQEKSGPQVELMKLAEQIDAVSGAAQWIKCDVQCLNKLISYGLDVNSRGPDGTTPLIAATHLRDLESVRLLLNAGARPNATDDRGYTPLMYAATTNDPAKARVLLAHGANIDAKSNEGFPALDMVAGASEVQRVLLKASGKARGN